MSEATWSEGLAVEEYATVGGAAGLLGIARTTLVSAVQRGAVASGRLASGEAVVLLRDVERWLASAELHRPGRRPRAAPAGQEKKPAIVDSSLDLTTVGAHHMASGGGNEQCE